MDWLENTHACDKLVKLPDIGWLLYWGHGTETNIVDPSLHDLLSRKLYQINIFRHFFT